MKVHRDVPMDTRTSFRIGGRARRLYELQAEQGIEELLQSLTDGLNGAQMMGRGSNLLLRDGTLDTPFVTLSGEFASTRVEGRMITAGAAVPFPELSMAAAQAGLTGLEWASGVPGTVGGAVMMNAGAFGVETRDRLEWVRYLDGNGEIQQSPARRLEFGYRYCELRDRALILRARFELEPADPDRVMEQTQNLIHTRREQQPVGQRSAGCIFQNPNGESAGELIDRAGLKGEQEGPIVVSSKHANYFINRGGGTRDQVLRLVDRVRERVQNRFGYELPLEIQVID